MNTFAKISLAATLTAAAGFCSLPQAAAQTADPEEHNLTFLLTGASFAVPENGWFEIACNDLGATAINKSVSGEAIYHTARRMDAGTFYTVEELDQVDVFVIGHVHNQNVANEQWLKENWEDYTTIATTTDYSVAYDYVIKRYIADCRALKDNPESRYYGTAEGKPVKIMFCTHWHDARTTYNPAIRKLSVKWGFPLVEFDDNIGFSRLDVAAGEEQPSLAVAHDTETIGGVKYGWHPLRGDNSYIQRRMAQIFEAEAAEYLGLEARFDYTLTPAVPVVAKGEKARMMVEFTGGHYPFFLTEETPGQVTGTAAAEGVIASPFFIDVDALDSDLFINLASATDSRGSVAASGALSASVLTADRTVGCSYDSFVHQAEQSKGHADATTLDLKNGDGWSRKIYITFPLDRITGNEERVAVRLHYESCVPGKLNNENRPLNGIESLDLEGNTSKYTANLTWDLHHTHQFEPVSSTILTQNMAGDWIGWDVTDFVKTKAAEGAAQVTFRISTPYKWRALTRFTSSESTAYPGMGPVMLIADPREISGLASAVNGSASGLSVNGDELLNPGKLPVRVFSPAGVCVLASEAADINLSALGRGVYVASAGSVTLKFAR